MRGNLSGVQRLQYAEHNNPAFDAPEGRQYAKNYQPRFIGARRASDSLKYFTVKTKAATKINSASLLRMALLGASGALYAAAIKNASVLTQAEGVYAYYKSHGMTSDTFRKWLQDNLRMILANKMSAFIATASSSAGTFNLTIDNPWVKSSGAPNCPVSSTTLVKFWMQLAVNPVLFKVDSATGIATVNDTFGDVAANEYRNVLGISIKEGSGEDAGAAMIGTLYVNYKNPDSDTGASTCQDNQSADGNYFTSSTFEGFGG